MTKTHRLFNDVYWFITRVFKKGIKTILLFAAMAFALAITTTYLLIALLIALIG